MSILIKFILQLALVAAYTFLSITEDERLLEVESSDVLSASLDFLLFIIIMDLVITATKFFYRKRTGLKFPEKDSAIFGIENLAKLLIGLAVVISVFAAFGIDFKSLLTSISIVAAALAIIAKDFINDYLIGIYLSFTKDFQIGDYVKIGDSKGTIVEIGMQKVRFQNDDDDVVLIPHSTIYTNEIINYTRRDIRKASIGFQLAVDRVGNLEAFESELIESLKGFEQYIEPDSYKLSVITIAKDSIDLKFQYRIIKIDYSIQRRIRRKTIREVFNHISRINAPIPSKY